MSEMTPAEIDAAWIEATAGARKLFEQANAAGRTAEKYQRYGGSYERLGEEYAERAASMWIRARQARDEAEAPFMAEWEARGGWTRAYVVPDGHIHKSTSCHTLYPTTIVSWIPEQSGMTEAEIVAAAGVHACTVCYPSAPVEALRAAEAAAKAEGECPGSRSWDYEAATWQRTSHTGSGRATCSHCGERVGTTTTGKMRAHPRA